MLSAGITGTADDFIPHILPTIQDSSLVFTQDGQLRQSVVQAVQALVQSCSADASASQAAPLLKVLLQLRASVVLAEPCAECQLQQVQLSYTHAQAFFPMKLMQSQLATTIACI